jgi:hypothetical protein
MRRAVKIRHAAALAFLTIVVAACETQSQQKLREQQALIDNPPKLTTTVASVVTTQQGSQPEWLLIVPPEEPRPFGGSRAMTEVPLSQWLVKKTYPTAADCDEVFHPKPKRTPGIDPNVPVIVIGPFIVQGDHRISVPPHEPPPDDGQCVSTPDPRLHPSETAGGGKP